MVTVGLGTGDEACETEKKREVHRGRSLFTTLATTCFIYDRRLEDLMLMKCA